MSDIFVEDRQQVFRVHFGFVIVDQSGSDLTIFEHLNKCIQNEIGDLVVVWNQHQGLQNVLLFDEVLFLFWKLQLVLVNFTQEQRQRPAWNHLYRKGWLLLQAVETGQC